MWSSALEAVAPVMASAVLAAALLVASRRARRAPTMAVQVSDRSGAVHTRREARATPLLERRRPRAAARERDPEEEPSGADGSGLRARMDEVWYSPGEPNVLAMTKYVDRVVVASPSASPEEGPGGVRLSRRDEGDRALLRVEGALDALTSAGLRGDLDALAAEGRRVVLDLSALQTIDSAGVALIAAFATRCQRSGGSVVVGGLRGQPLSVCRLLQLDRFVTLA